MATTTGSIVFYDSAIEDMLETNINMGDTSADGFGVLLLTSSYTPNVATQSKVSNIDANEIGTTGGYVRKNLTSASSSQTGGNYTFDAANVAWTASGASITARYWALYFDNAQTDAAAQLICYGVLDTTAGGTDVTATSGNTLTIQWNASGIFTGSMTDA